MIRHVACPVALHPDGAPLRLPVFEHPDTSLHLIKGDLKVGEIENHAAARVLFDTTGLETRSALTLGTSDTIEQNTVWHFSLCRITPATRDAWQHYSKSDALLLKFKWIALTEEIALNPPHLAALTWIRGAL